MGKKSEKKSRIIIFDQEIRTRFLKPFKSTVDKKALIKLTTSKLNCFLYKTFYETY